MLRRLPLLSGSTTRSPRTPTSSCSTWAPTRASSPLNSHLRVRGARARVFGEQARPACALGGGLATSPTRRSASSTSSSAVARWWLADGPEASAARLRGHGAGASSARLERFLRMPDDDLNTSSHHPARPGDQSTNWQVREPRAPACCRAATEGSIVVATGGDAPPPRTTTTCCGGRSCAPSASR